MRSAPFALLGLLYFATIPAFASPAAQACDRTMAEVDEAKAIFIGKAKSVDKSTKDGQMTVRVTYTIDQAVLGAKTAEIVVEDSCKLGAPTLQESGYPGVASYCNPAHHSMPGLDEGGTPATSSAALAVVEDKSVVDGKPVWRIVKKSIWGPCPDEAALLKKRPALKDLVAKVRDTNAKTTFGFPEAPPATSGSASTAPPPPPSATASSSATPASTGSSGPAPSTSSAPAPQKSGGCSSCSVSDASSGFASAWPLVGLVLVSLSRFRRRAS